MGIFERWLSLSVALAIAAGLEPADINLVIAVLIWLMIYPMMLAFDFSAVRRTAVNSRC